MGYMHIDNLYKNTSVLEFKRCYALEKIHGTSAHVSWKDGKLTFFSGGESHEKFLGVFDIPALTARFAEKYPLNGSVVVFGEAYGGKCQGMSKTYGAELKFVAFDVRMGDRWLSVPHAAAVVEDLGLEFVDYVDVSTDMDVLNAERDKPSTQAVRNGITDGPKMREGVVLRPRREFTCDRGERVMAKHKRAEFSERGTNRVDIDPTKLGLLEEATAIAVEWVTVMRLEHVLDKIRASRDNKVIEMSDTRTVIDAMIEDVMREGAGEIVDSKAARKAIATMTVGLFKVVLERGIQHD